MVKDCKNRSTVEFYLVKKALELHKCPYVRISVFVLCLTTIVTKFAKLLAFSLIRSTKYIAYQPRK